jgi:putative ABC transport system ATP-binding protein
MANLVLTIQQVSLSFPKLSRPVLQDISYDVAANDFIVILGSNGSGKSSLLKLVNRAYSTKQGKIMLNGQPIETYTAKVFNGMVKTLSQDCDLSLFTSLTVLENCLLACASKVMKDRQGYFQDYLAQFNPNLAHKLQQQVASLSGGEKQALALALAVLVPPQILLLDEHTSALDPKSAAHLMALTDKIIRQKQITCLLTTHDLNHAQRYGNRVLALRNGEIYQTFAGDKKQNLTHDSLLAACY